VDCHGILNLILKSLSLGPLNRLAGGAFGSLKGLLIVLITMQGVGPWVESSPHWKQSKFVQIYCLMRLSDRVSKDAAMKRLHI
jgi:membrane protein required for colicin V production